MSAEDTEWFRSRLAAHAAGLLTEDEEARFESLLETDTCAQIYRDFSEPGEGMDDPGHVAPELLARWEASSQGLRGLERRLVRSHLESCDDCRQELQLLGFEPVLAFDPTLEAGGEPASPGIARRAADVVRGEARNTIEVVTQAAEQGRRAWGWVVSGWTTAAATAAALLFVIMRSGGPGVSGQLVLGDLAMSPVAIHGDTRTGSPEDVAEIRVGADTRLIALDLATLNIGVGTGDLEQMRLEIAVLSPDGSVVGRLEATAGDISRLPIMLHSGDRPFVPGDYQIEVSGDVTGESTHAFRLVRE